MKIRDVPPGERRVHFIVYIALVIIALGLLTVSYWLLAPSDVLEIKNAPVPIRTIREHPTAEGVVILNVDYCKKVGATGQVRVSFVSQSREIFLPIAVDKAEPKCEKVEVPVLIPHDTPSDTYIIRYYITYKVNPLRSTIEQFDSQEFHVN